MTFTWRKVKNKFVINKNGVYLALTSDDIKKLEATLLDIKSGEKKHYQEDNR